MHPSSKRTRKHKSSQKVDVKKLWDILDTHEDIHVENHEISEDNDICPKCDVPFIVDRSGFYVCDICGFLMKEVVDQTPEWRFFGNDDNNTSADPSRCGMPVDPQYSESAFGSKVMSCKGKIKCDLKHLQQFTKYQSAPYREQSHYEESQHIKNLASINGISEKIINTACHYREKILTHTTFRGINREGIIAASIYLACRKLNCPRTDKEIANVFNIEPGEATNGCNLAMHIINIIENDYDEKDKTQFENTKPEAFIDRYCSKLNINDLYTKLCLFIAKCVEQRELIPGNVPQSIATGIVYFVSQRFGLQLTKQNIYEISKVSEVTINKCFNLLEDIENGTKKFNGVHVNLIPTELKKKTIY